MSLSIIRLTGVKCHPIRSEPARRSIIRMHSTARGKKLRTCNRETCRHLERQSFRNATRSRLCLSSNEFETHRRALCKHRRRSRSVFSVHAAACVSVPTKDVNVNANSFVLWFRVRFFYFVFFFRFCFGATSQIATCAQIIGIQSGFCVLEVTACVHGFYLHKLLLFPIVSELTAATAAAAMLAALVVEYDYIRQFCVGLCFPTENVE